ncbi:MAG: hypothetical protein R3D80_20870 [Paracoccaceae bacterium]
MRRAADTAAAGPRPITHARVLNIAVPVFANATAPILGAVDTGVVGQLGAAARRSAPSGSGAIVLGSVYWIFGFLRMGTAG